MKRLVVVLAVLIVFGWPCVKNLYSKGGIQGGIGYSLSDSGDLDGNQIGKEEILAFEEVSGSRMLFSNEGIAFMLGDVNGDGKEDAPSNVDAIHVEPEVASKLPCALFFSTTSNGCGLKDGDVVRFLETGGADIYLPESYFVNITGASDGNVDVDAFSVAPTGHIYFSFAENEDSTILSGSQPNVIADGDILCLPPGGSVHIAYTEDKVSDMISNALGKSYKAVDVQGLCYDPAAGFLLFTVQSPTAHDASVFSDEADGTLVPGYDEASLGFSNGVEMDGLSVLPSLHDMPSLEIDPRYPVSGDAIEITISGPFPSEPYLLLFSGEVTSSPVQPFLGGFGSLLLDMNHPYFIACILGLSNLSGICDAQGNGTFQTTLPPYASPFDIHLQVVEPVAEVYSHPMTLEMNQ